MVISMSSLCLLVAALLCLQPSWGEPTHLRSNSDSDTALQPRFEAVGAAQRSDESVSAGVGGTFPTLKTIGLGIHSFMSATSTKTGAEVNGVSNGKVGIQYSGADDNPLGREMGNFVNNAIDDNSQWTFTATGNTGSSTVPSHGTRGGCIIQHASEVTNSIQTDMDALRGAYSAGWTNDQWSNANPAAANQASLAHELRTTAFNAFKSNSKSGETMMANAKFFIKSQPAAEVLKYISMLHNIKDRFVDQEHPSFLNPIYWILTLKCGRIKYSTKYFVVMPNIDTRWEPLSRKTGDCLSHLMWRFDLKGSTAGRYEPDDGNTGKDKNFLRAISLQSYQKFYGRLRSVAAENAREKLVGGIAKDLKVLKTHGIVDYSMMAFIVKLTHQRPMNLHNCQGWGNPGPVTAADVKNIVEPGYAGLHAPVIHLKDEADHEYLVFLTLIDYLVGYGKNRKAQAALNSDGTKSARDPNNYATRMLAYLDVLFFRVADGPNLEYGTNLMEYRDECGADTKHDFNKDKSPSGDVNRNAYREYLKANHGISYLD